MGSPKEKSFTEEIKCTYCGNLAPMEIVAVFSRVSEVCDERSKFSWEEGPVWQLLSCPACLEISLRKVYYHDGFTPEEWKKEILYPTSVNKIIGLPAKVKVAYETALKVSNIDPNAYAVLLGRVIDTVCIDRKAKGDSLAERIKDLANKNEIPCRLADIAHQLRQLRNIGAHADLGNLTKDEIPILSDLCKAILEYVYTAPALIDQVKKHFTRLNKKKLTSK